MTKILLSGWNPLADETHSHLRRQEEERHGFLQYVQFLNHELRTPLTAARTALEILCEELTGCVDDRRHEFARIALRNVQRLNRTVDWSEDYLASRNLPEAADWRVWTVQDLVTRAAPEAEKGEEFRLEVPPAVAAARLTCDAGLFRTLLLQVLHAVSLHAPDRQVVLRAHLEPAAESPGPEPAEAPAGRVVFAYHLGPQDVRRAGNRRVVRTGLVSGQERPEEEFARLIEFSVSGEIRGLLGAEIEVHVRPADDEPVVSLALPRREPPSLQSTRDPVSWARRS